MNLHDSTLLTWCDVVTCWVCWRPHTTEPRAAARCCAAVHGALLRPPPRHTSRDTPSGHRRHCCGLLLRPWRCDGHTFTTVYSLNCLDEGVVKVLHSDFIDTLSHLPRPPQSCLYVPLHRFCEYLQYLYSTHRRSWVIFRGGPTILSCQNSIPSCQNFFLSGGPSSVLPC